jgi:hypothetical protein
MLLDDLGRALQAAFRLNRADAETWAASITSGATTAAVRALVRAYLRGRAVGYQVHGRMVGAPASLPARIVRAWRAAGEARALALTSRAVRTFDEQGDLTRAFVRAYAAELTNQTTWSGNDDAFRSLSREYEVEFKRWVRAWPRTSQRDWHDALEDALIPVDDLYTLPGGPNVGTQVYGPRDWDRADDPGEHMHCGHALAFELAPARGDVLDTIERGVYDPRNQPRTR